MPLVTAIAVIFGDPNEQFKLIFPILNVFSVMLAVFTLVFVSREGHTNYFIGMMFMIPLPTDF
jgi:Ca2+/H+ antiporter